MSGFALAQSYSPNSSVTWITGRIPWSYRLVYFISRRGCCLAAAEWAAVTLASPPTYLVQLLAEWQSCEYLPRYEISSQTHSISSGKKKAPQGRQELTKRKKRKLKAGCFLSQKFTENINSLHSFLVSSLTRTCIVGAKKLVLAIILPWLCRGKCENAISTGCKEL